MLMQLFMYIFDRFNCFTLCFVKRHHLSIISQCKFIDMKSPRYPLIRYCKQPFKRKKVFARNEIILYSGFMDISKRRLLLYKKNTCRRLQIIKLFSSQFPKIHVAAIKKTTTNKFESKRSHHWKTCRIVLRRQC